MSASTQDNQAPFDPTGYDSISGAQLKQLLDGMFPYTDKGMVVMTQDVAGVPDVPDAATTTKWRNFIWLRVGVSAVTPYIWNNTAASHVDGDGNNILKWYTIASASIGVGTITNDMIANYTIENEKIVTLSASKLTGSLPSTVTDTVVEVGDAAGGSLAGTYPNPSIAANGVVTASITDLAVTNAKLEAATTTTGIDVAAKVKPNTVGLTRPRTNVGATAVEWFVPNDLESQAAADVAVAANAGKYLKVHDSLAKYELVAFPTVTLPSIAGQYYTGITATTVDNVAVRLLQQLFPHSLVTVPKLVRCVFVCQSTDLGYAAGDEVDGSLLQTSNGDCVLTVSADVTNVKVRLASYTVMYLVHATTASFGTMDETKWKIKVYAWK